MSERQSPTISVEFDLDEGAYVLMASSYGRTNPAGDRLLHIPFGCPWPTIKYVCATQEEAEANVALLRHALANPPKKTRKGNEEAGVMEAKLKEAVWNL